MIDLHQDDLIWLNKLAFFEDELAIMQRRVQEVAGANAREEVQQQVEHFDNQLRVQQRNIDDIRNRIQMNEDRLFGSAEGKQDRVTERERIIHVHEKKEIEDFEENFKKLREELKQFLLNYL